MKTYCSAAAAVALRAEEGQARAGAVQADGGSVRGAAADVQRHAVQGQRRVHVAATSPTYRAYGFDLIVHPESGGPAYQCPPQADLVVRSRLRSTEPDCN